VLSFIVDNRGKTAPTAESGIPLIATNCIKNDQLYPVFEKIRYISEETYKNWFRSHPIPGDIIFVNKGTPGRVCLVPDPVGFCIAQDMMALRANDKIINNKYLFAVLRSPQFQTQIEQFHVGTLIPHFKKGDLDKLLIPIPTMEVQQLIGETYYTLSNMIELNNRTNRLLEEMARAIFKSWFVDFDPVRYKAAGQEPPGLAPSSADLFPDEFEDSELGEIPRGWKIGTVRDLGNIICGKTPPTAQLDNYGDDVPFVTIPDMHGKVFVTSAQKSLSLKGAATQTSKTLPPYSICVSCIATPGLVVLTSEKCQTNQQINSVIPSNINTSLFCYFTLKNLGQQIRSHGAGGSVLLNLNKGQFEALKIIIPPASLMEVYQQSIGPLFAQLLNNDRQMSVLASIRDCLLPKLISGELRISDAERIVEHCV
jgi:type I restriction enzyme S subunit